MSSSRQRPMAAVPSRAHGRSDPASTFEAAGALRPPASLGPIALGAGLLPWLQLRRWPVKAYLGLLVTLAVLNLFRHARFFHDDAFITLRYARNLIATGEPVWNHGEWVEGYTSLMHLAIVAAVGWLSGAEGDAWVGVTRGINAVALLCTMAATAQAVHAASAQRVEAWRTGCLVLVAATPLWVWMWGGLEAIVAAAWVSLGLWAWMKSAVWTGTLKRPGWLWTSGVFMALAVATRPDTLVLVAGGAAAWVLGGPSEGGRQGQGHGLQARALAMLRWVSPVLLVHALVLAWRWQTYHAWAPNTYYAKVDGIAWTHRVWTGLHYLGTCLWDVPYLPALALALAWDAQLRRDALLRWATLTLAIMLAGIVWVGGDHMQVSRFLVPSVPLLALAATRCALAPPRSSRVTWVLAIALVATVLSPVVRRSQYRDSAAWAGQLVGQLIAAQWPQGSLVALNTAGAPAFHAPGLRFIDMLGLNDAHIAHRQITTTDAPMQSVPGHMKGDGAYVMSRQPDFIITGFAEGQLAAESMFLGDRELARLPEFKRCYRFEQVDLPFDQRYASMARHPPPTLQLSYYRRTCPHSGAAAASGLHEAQVAHAGAEVAQVGQDGQQLGVAQAHPAAQGGGVLVH